MFEMTEREERDYHVLRILMEEHDFDDIDEAKDYLADLERDAAYVYGAECCEE